MKCAVKVNMKMSGHDARYSTLKVELVKAAGNSFSLAQIKEHFAAAINSKRALGRVIYLCSFIRLLEERDLINSRKISCLQQLAELLQNDKMKELLHTFKKLYLDGIEEELCTCGIRTNFQQDHFPMSQQQGNQNFSDNNSHIIPASDLTQAFQNVSEGIGKHWAVLARALDISEGGIDRIRAEYPKEYEQQALAALNLWLRRKRENASIQILEIALNSKDCIRKGLGSYLLEPRIVRI